MHILITGATGLIGRALRSRLIAQNHTIVAYSRRPQPEARNTRWIGGDADEPTTFAAAMAEADAVINLAGSPIITRWSAKARQEICDSRVRCTSALVSALKVAPKRPRVWLNASAIGYYGSAPDGPCDESRAAGQGFLADVARSWEAAAAPAEQVANTRVVYLRLGVVLAHQGGALTPMVAASRAFIGGPLGPGTQWISWVHLEDVVGMICWALATSNVKGPLNVVAPNATRQAELMAVLGKIFRRPSFLRTPAGVLRLTMGAMADELLLASQEVIPKQALDEGFVHQFAQLEPALKNLVAP